jgi:DNA-binding NtrC family response regulator
MSNRKPTRPVPTGAIRSLTPLCVRVTASGAEIRAPEPGDKVRIGSAGDNDLVLDDDHVSASHCVIERRARHQLMVRDSHSTNGTWVDGVRITEAAAQVGAKVQVGRSQLLVLGRPEPAGPGGPILGQAPALLRARGLAERAARTLHPVLLRGESGSGKELFARLLHDASRRAAGPLVAINCGALPEHLVESELFGHERGAFTGASERRSGVFEQASGGTLFLDEIAELPVSQQPKLLRVLESGKVRRVGAPAEIPVDVRIVAASHRDLGEEVASGAFRLDLYHRLRGIEIIIPPLRERPGDLPELIASILGELERDHGAHQLTAAAFAALRSHAWPGNVRELKQVLARAVALADSSVLDLADLGLESRRAAATATTDADADGGSMEEVMRQAMVGAIERHGSQRRAAQALQMPRSTFNERVHRYGLGGLLRARRRRD